MKNICFQMNRKAWLVIAMALFMAFPALAQKITVTGTVYDPEGEPAIGASVTAKGSATGVATDIDGNFTISVKPDATLVVSLVGCQNQEAAVNGQNHLVIHLKSDAEVLKEFVVVGYGQIKKADATGSVAVIKPDDIETGIATSTQDLLVGASPGVVVTTDGGNPTGNATIRIRGGSSLSANNNPLIVIDGVPMTDQSNAGGTNALTMINPQDIESMTILKDASATAIYGSRASNGVIIVTTKKGQSGAPKVNFAANFHVNTARNTLNMMTADQLRAIVVSEQGEEFANQYMGSANTNWQKEVLRTAFSHDYSLSVAGATKVLPYRVSGSFTDNAGILKNNNMQRATVGFNLSPKFFNGLLQVNANANGTYIKTRNADTGAVGNAVRFNPSYAVKTAYATNGSAGLTMYNGYTNYLNANGSPNSLTMLNPVQMLEDVNSQSQVLSSNGNLQIDYALHFLPELHFNLNLGYQVSENQAWSDTAANSMQAWRNQSLANFGAPGAGTHYRWYELQRNTLLDFYANYRKLFDEIKSNVDVMVGYSWQKFTYFGRSQTYVGTEGFYANGVNPIYNASTGEYTLDYDSSTSNVYGQPVSNAPKSRWGNPVQLVSFFGRLNYSFDDTYLLTFTLRDDASSRFSKDARWGLFPSVALGWKLINLPVFESAQNTINDLKLRLGWGVTGQQDIGSYFPYLPTYTESYKQGFQYIDQNGNWINPLYPNAYDTKIKWEETTTWNVGLDFAFLNNRITVAADWYKRKTKDLICYAPTAGINTSNYLYRNVGSLTNDGVEFNVVARPVVGKEFSWTTGVNIAHNSNKITKLTGESNSMASRYTPDGVGTALTYFVVGEPSNTFMVYQQVYDADGNPLPGQYVDQNGDGAITADDKIAYHSPDPKWTFNWNNTFNYKNWDFGITLRANLGNYVYNGPRYMATRLGDLVTQGIQVSNLMADEFLFPNKAYSDLNLSSYWIENASFIRCDNISAGYTFDNLLHNKLNLRVFGVVQNPFVITKYKGLDPEVYSGIDNNCYPRPITFTVGLTANF
jgi:iron complex outermembrane receptor protein